MLQMIKFQKTTEENIKYNSMTQIASFFIFLLFFSSTNTLDTFILLYYTLMKDWVRCYKLKIKKTKDLV